MSKVLNRKCYSCGVIYPVISEDVFFSRESKDGVKDMACGVRWVEDAFASEIYGDETKHWECNNCWWQGWWDI